MTTLVVPYHCDGGVGAAGDDGEVVAPDRAVHPASVVRTARQERASQKRIAPHPIASPRALLNTN